MAQLPAAFNPQAPGQEGVGDFSAIDPGDYTAQITDSKMKETKNKQGQFLELTWGIMEGDLAGRKLWSRLNLINPSTQAVEIAQKHLKSICDAMGVPGPISDSQVLHGKPCIIRVVKTPATAQYPEGNDIKNYMPIGGAVPGGIPVPAAAAAASPFPAQAAAAPVAAPAAAVAAPTPAAAAVAAAAVPNTAPAEVAAEEEPAATKPPWLK